MLRELFILTKPGITRSNTLAAAAGFFFAARGDIDWAVLLALLVGTAAIIASGCVLNNILDRDIDARMERTKKRATVTGSVSVPAALIFAALLSVGGGLILASAVNLLTAALGLTALFLYVVVYGYAKRHTPLSTIIGTFPGAIPPMAGYTAVTGQIDAAAGLLFASMALWQMPHFYAISIYRYEDYKRAGLPVWSVAHGLKEARNHMIAFIVLYLAAVPAFVWLADASLVYLIAMGLLSAWWLWQALQGLKLQDKELPRWAKKIFGISLIVLLSWIVLIATNWLLP